MSSKRARPWPWQRKGAKTDKWSIEAIFNYLAKDLERRGVTRDRLASDLVSHLALNYWIKMHATDALQHGIEDVLGGKAVTLAASSSKSINAAYKSLGVYPYGSIAELPEDGEEDIPDFS